MKIPITVCLFTTTKGHWGEKNRYLETIEWLNNKIPLSNFAGLVAHIKVSIEDGGRDQLQSMIDNLSKYGFEIIITNGEWAHGHHSHQSGYRGDLYKVYNDPRALKSTYVLHLEDDFRLNALEGELIEWFYRGVKILESNPEILQVRFARFCDEFDRINKLRVKHGLDADAVKLDETDDYFVHNDFGLNPSIFRSRDLKLALMLWTRNINSFGDHVEMGFGKAVKYLSNIKTPLAVLNPHKVKAAHRGVPRGEEEPHDKFHYAD